MKKLERRFKKQRNTVEAYVWCNCTGVCCPCAYCAATWMSQNASDAAHTRLADVNNNHAS